MSFYWKNNKHKSIQLDLKKKLIKKKNNNSNNNNKHIKT
jgi:hypothetical protein